MKIKPNTFLRKLSIPLNVINIAVGLALGIAHVYLPLASPFGLALGILTALSGSVSIGISYYFTYKTTEKNQLKNDAQSTAHNKQSHFWFNVLFLGIAIPTILLNAVAGFFGMYTGIMLLAVGFGMPFTAPIMATAIIFAVIFTTSTLINAWLQANFIWQSFNQPKQINTQKTTKDTATQTETIMTTLAAYPPQLTLTPENIIVSEQPQEIQQTFSQSNDLINHTTPFHLLS